MNRYQKLQGIIIKKQALSESDLLITILSKHDGKIVCQAKGVKNIKSRRLGNLELGNIVKAQIYTKQDFAHLTEIENLQKRILDSPNLTQISMLFYFFELLNQLLPQKDFNPKIYDLTLKTLRVIQKEDLSSFIQAEILLCQLLGFGPPPEIIRSYQSQNQKQTQQLLNAYFENLIQKPLQSLKLFM
jgi:DNA repair protein RecO